MKSMQVYLDNAATTPLHPKVLEAMIPYLKDWYGNPSSVHSYGTKIRVAIEEAREIIASEINAKPSEIFFLSGGTESDNFVIKGIVNTASKESNKRELLTSSIEHHAVLDTINSFGGEYIKKYASLNNDGSINFEQLQNEELKNVLFASFMNVNNELGSVTDIAKFTKIANQHNILTHSDCVQSFCKYKIDVKSLSIDSISGSAHKINGPKGIGFAYVKTGTPMESLLLGGGQERNRRGGTENVAGIIGFAEAVKIFSANRNFYFEHVNELKKRFIAGLNQLDSRGIVINNNNNSSPFILNITLNNHIYKNDLEAILVFLDINGVAVSSGAACSSGSVKSSHVLLGVGKSVEEAQGTFRISFGYQNKVEEIDYALSVIEKLLKQIKR